MTSKIEAIIGSEAVPLEYGNTFARETVGGQDRLIVGMNEAQDECFRELGSGLAGPFKLLYVLHTTRIDAELGRYESPALTWREVDEFLERFGAFLAQDARHDFWLRSRDDDATIVLERHNLIYAYGPLTQFEAVLLRIGARLGEAPKVPAHAHHYHDRWDETERAILAALPWVREPLRESDVQGHSGDGLME